MFSEKFHNTVLKIKCRVTLVLALIFIILLATIIIMKLVFTKKNFKNFETEESLVDRNIVEVDEDAEYFLTELEEFELTDENKKEDYDEDKLTNEEEMELGTDPLMMDTDGDGLSDYDEVKKYSSDPLKYSTAEDDISDYAKVKLELDVNEKMNEDDFELEEMKTKNDRVTLIPENIEAQTRGNFQEYTTDSNLDTNEKIFSVYEFKGKIKYELTSGNDAMLLTYYNGEYTEYDKYQVDGKIMTIEIDEDDNSKDFIITTNRNYKAYLKGEDK